MSQKEEEELADRLLRGLRKAPDHDADPDPACDNCSLPRSKHVRTSAIGGWGTHDSVWICPKSVFRKAPR